MVCPFLCYAVSVIMLNVEQASRRGVYSDEEGDV